MKVLYAAMYHDPRDPDASSGVDYNFYSAICRYAENVVIAGPYRMQGSLPERIFQKLYIRKTNKRYMKWNLRAVYHASRDVNRLERHIQPDVVFTIFPSTLVLYNGQAPCVLNTDTTFLGWQESWPEFGNLALCMQVLEERIAVRKSAYIITFSEWCRQEIIHRHAFDPNKIEAIPMPSALPVFSVPDAEEIEILLHSRIITTPLRLLTVGRDYKRKGIDISIQIARLLNESGIPTELTVCGIQGEYLPHTHFVGPYNKSDPDQLREYTDLYRQAHFLIHPALFDPSPIVPAEAAAFGVPTISNNTGGIATSVRDGISGVVLPKASPAEAYVQVIRGFLDQPHLYVTLCRSARKRYEQELNWDVAGKRLEVIFRKLVETHPRNGPKT